MKLIKDQWITNKYFRFLWEEGHLSAQISVARCMTGVFPDRGQGLLCQPPFLERFAGKPAFNPNSHPARADSHSARPRTHIHSMQRIYIYIYIYIYIEVPFNIFVAFIQTQ
jgi:hypothetical protein